MKLNNSYIEERIKDILNDIFISEVDLPLGKTEDNSTYATAIHKLVSLFNELVALITSQRADAVKETATEIKLMIQVLSADKKVTDYLIQEIDKIYLKEQNI